MTIFDKGTLPPNTAVKFGVEAALNDSFIIKVDVVLLRFETKNDCPG